jgi:hypothetical protein
MSLDVRRAMTAFVHARNDAQPTLAGRMEATMETFLWLVGWNTQPPIDSQGGRATFDDCANRDDLRNSETANVRFERAEPRARQ